jgi:hypothetical protein
VLTCRLADALYRVGDLAAAERAATAALDQIGDSELVVDMCLVLTSCQVWSGRFEDALATLAVRQAHAALPAHIGNRLRVLAARIHNLAGHFETAEPMAREALAEALRSADEWAVGRALHVLSFTLLERGETTEALALIQQAFDRIG